MPTKTIKGMPIAEYHKQLQILYRLRTNQFKEMSPEELLVEIGYYKKEDVKPKNHS